MMRKILIFTLIALTGVISISQAQERTLRRKVAIGRFSNETQYSKSVFYDKDNDPVGKQASDILAAKLASTGKFLLIERQDYDKIINEINTGGVVQNTIGADFLIIGSITEFGRKTTGTQRIFSNSKEQTVEAGVSIRLVDVSTGLVIFSGEAKGEAVTEDKRVMGIGKSADFDATLSDKAISAAINKMVENIIFKLTDNPWRAYILSQEEDVLIISGGRSQGIGEGDEFLVYERGKKVRNPQNGLYVELPGKLAGKIKVTGTIGSMPQDEISTAIITEGSIDINSLEKYYITDIK